MTAMVLPLAMAWLAEWDLGILGRGGDNGGRREDDPAQAEFERYTRLSRLDLNGGKDHYALTQRDDNLCVISIAGTNSASDMGSNVDVTEGEYCGFTDVHSGLIDELEVLIQSDAWQNNWMPVLSNSSECSEVHITGHSLGGAQASLLAACANNGTSPWGFEVEGLWTFGAFAPSKTPLPNNIWQAQGQTQGCFNGARYYNQDSGNYDAVPSTTTSIGYHHPRVQARMLSRRFSWVRVAEVEIFTYDCDSQCAHDYPEDDPYWAIPSPLADHSMGASYLPRMHDWLDPSSTKTTHEHNQTEWPCELGSNPLQSDGNTTNADSARTLEMPLIVAMLAFLMLQ